MEQSWFPPVACFLFVFSTWISVHLQGNPGALYLLDYLTNQREKNVLQQQRKLREVDEQRLENVLLSNEELHGWIIACTCGE